MKLIYSFLLLIAFLSCTKTAVNPSSQSIIGSWLLTESLADPGDGSGKWQKATNNEVITFGENGSYTSTHSFGFSQFKLSSDSSFVLSAPTNASTWSISFKITGEELELRPQCIEACGSKYKRQSAD